MKNFQFNSFLNGAKKISSNLIKQSENAKENLIEQATYQKYQQKKERLNTKIQRLEDKLSKSYKMKPQKINELNQKLQALLEQRNKMIQNEVSYEDFKVAIKNIQMQIDQQEALVIEDLSKDEQKKNYKIIKNIRRQVYQIYREAVVNLQKHQTANLMRRCDNLLEQYFLHNIDEEENIANGNGGESQVILQQSQSLYQQQQQQQKQQIQQPQQDIEINDQSLCQICFENKKEYIAVPCGHFIYCGDCRNLIKNNLCLICRNQITQIIKVYQ